MSIEEPPPSAQQTAQDAKPPPNVDLPDSFEVATEEHSDRAVIKVFHRTSPPDPGPRKRAPRRARLRADHQQGGGPHARDRCALAALPDDQRRVIEMAYFGGMTQTESAERLWLPVGTVNSRTRLGLT
jgi:DNA-directed RNA polymerase specialized sigma24 family protein